MGTKNQKEPTQPRLLDREEFKEAVFNRDKGQCVVCGKAAVDAHHLMERRLWKDGGYYLDNGVALCMGDHLKAEYTLHPPEYLRYRAGITQVLLPECLDEGGVYDKWGNEILTPYHRARGPLFYDEAVQKVLKEAHLLDHFRDERVKYPRTPHLPFSGQITVDQLKGERVMLDPTIFCQEEIVITEKMDGEQTNWYREFMHARSLDSEGFPHPSRDRIKQLRATIAGDIPNGWRICGENLTAKHTIHYHQLSSYFMVYSIWDNHNNCLSWDETVFWCDLLGLTTVPVLFKGKIQDLQYLEKLTCLYDRVPSYSEVSQLKENWESLHTLNPSGMDEREGFVVRVAREFHYKEFGQVCAKYVRPGHVDPQATHWSKFRYEMNSLRKSKEL